MSFAEIVGHQRQLKTLHWAMAGGRLHHAYLFLGADGVGKRLVAMSLAKAIHCVASDQDYCGQCVNCARITGGNHPDVRLIEPLADKKEISIQQIRDLQRELNYRSFGGKRKVAIIDPASLMNSSAQNALLKTLEEPPADSLIVLIASNAGGLLRTLLSRCLRLFFVPLPSAQVAAFLQSKRGMKPDEAGFVAAMSMGSIGVAANIDKDEVVEKRQIWSGMLNSLKVEDYQGAINAAEALAGKRDEALEFLRWAETWYRDLLVYKVTHRSDELVNLDNLAQIAEQSTKSGIDRAVSTISHAQRAAAGIQRNLNRRMVLEKFLFDVVRGR
jgi:DNA polymerase III subunit delta'